MSDRYEELAREFATSTTGLLEFRSPRAAQSYANLLIAFVRRVAEEAQQDGIVSVLTIRCMEHRNVPQYNTKEAAGGECAACEVEPLRAALETEREHSGVLSRANQHLADELSRRPK